MGDRISKLLLVVGSCLVVVALLQIGGARRPAPTTEKAIIEDGMALGWVVSDKTYTTGHRRIRWCNGLVVERRKLPDRIPIPPSSRSGTACLETQAEPCKDGSGNAVPNCTTYPCVKEIAWHEPQPFREKCGQLCATRKSTVASKRYDYLCYCANREYYRTTIGQAAGDCADAPGFSADARARKWLGLGNREVRIARWKQRTFTPKPWPTAPWEVECASFCQTHGGPDHCADTKVYRCKDGHTNQMAAVHNAFDGLLDLIR